MRNFCLKLKTKKEITFIKKKQLAKFTTMNLWIRKRTEKLDLKRKACSLLVFKVFILRSPNPKFLDIVSPFNQNQ